MPTIRDPASITGGRDPLALSYDPFVERVLRQAIRHHRDNPREPRAVEVFIASPPREFRDLDFGGKTYHEREFIRAVQYRVFKVPYIFDVPTEWSVRIAWGPIQRRGARWGRPARVRLFSKAWGARYVDKIMRKDPWRDDLDGTGSWRDGTRRSMPGARIDQNRKRRQA